MLLVPNVAVAATEAAEDLLSNELIPRPRRTGGRALLHLANVPCRRP